MKHYYAQVSFSVPNGTFIKIAKANANIGQSIVSYFNENMGNLCLKAS